MFGTTASTIVRTGPTGWVKCAQMPVPVRTTGYLISVEPTSVLDSWCTRHDRKPRQYGFFYHSCVPLFLQTITQWGGTRSAADRRIRITLWVYNHYQLKFLTNPSQRIQERNHLFHSLSVTKDPHSILVIHPTVFAWWMNNCPVRKCVTHAIDLSW